MPETKATIVVEVKNEGSKAITDLGSQMQQTNVNLNKLTLASGGATKGTSALTQGLGQLTQRFTGVNLATMGWVGGIGLAVGGLAKATAATLKYGLQVADTAQKLGISSRAASYMIQMADDLRIETGTMEVAFRNLVNKGTQPTIENLMELARQYQALTDPVEKAQFAMDKFGMRAGLEMQKLLAQTPASIRAMADSADLAGILGDEATAKIKRFQTIVDGAKDTWAGMTYALGQGVVEITNAVVPTEERLSQVYYERSEKMKLYAQQHGYVTDAVRLEANAAAEAAQATDQWASARENLSKMGELTITTTNKLKTVQEGWLGIGQQVADMLGDYLPMRGQAAINALGEIDEHTGTLAQDQVLLERDIRRAILSYTKTGDLDAFGEAIDKIGEKALGTGESYQESAGNAAEAAAAYMDAQNYLNAIPDVTTKYVNFIMTWGGTPPPSGTPRFDTEDTPGGEQQASGGDLTVGEVGEQGAEGIVRTGTGYRVVPHARWEQMKRGRGWMGRKFGTGGTEDVYVPPPGKGDQRGGHVDQTHTEDPSSYGQWNAPGRPHSPQGGGGKPKPPSTYYGEQAADISADIMAGITPLMSIQMQQMTMATTEQTSVLRELLAETRKQATNDGVGSSVANAMQQGNMMG